MNSTVRKRKEYTSVFRGGAAALRCFIFAALFAPAPHAQARIIQPGEGNDSLVDPLTGVSLAERPELAGEIIADLLVPFTNVISVEGTVRTQVVREAVTGTLDFYYTVTPANDVLTISGFDNFLTDVDWRKDLGKGASGAFRTPEGDTLILSFNSGGTTFVKTDATEFALTGSLVFSPDNGDPAFTAATVYAPAAIPLPPALLAAPPAFALAVLAQRRFKTRRGQ
jgi:hypothetical protein